MSKTWETAEQLTNKHCTKNFVKNSTVPKIPTPLLHCNTFIPLFEAWTKGPSPPCVWTLNSEFRWVRVVTEKKECGCSGRGASALSWLMNEAPWYQTLMGFGTQLSKAPRKRCAYLDNPASHSSYIYSKFLWFSDTYYCWLLSDMCYSKHEAAPRAASRELDH
jgi:hypothetical protein